MEEPIKDEFLEERWNDPANHKDGTYVFPLEYSIRDYRGVFITKPTEQGKLLLTFIRRQLMQPIE